MVVSDMVVSDTSPLNYLVLIDLIGVLQPLCGHVAVPSAVQQEMLAPLAPAAVNRWALSPPSWVSIRDDTGHAELIFDRRLGPGERQAIALTYRNSGSLLPIDETLSRATAEHYGLNFIGTIGILREAHLQQRLDITEALGRLARTNFQMSPNLVRRLLNSV